MSENKGMTRIIASFSLIVYMFVCFPVNLIAEESRKTKIIDENIVKELITKTGGEIKLGDASIVIPEGALKKNTEISITHLEKVADTGESLYNAIPGFGGYRFLPAGTKFEKDVIITLPYDPMLNEKPQSLEELYTYFYDTEKLQWIKLERLEVDKEKCVVRSLTTHFTDMINATLTLPESASPVDVNLNSIKNLEAAKPDSHLIKFNPPKASNMGDANFSFELGVMAGRKGLQPQISISYSSGAGNGIMGKGFDVSYGGSVTTDTRFGLPKYDTNDTYMLDGILLEEVTRNNNTITYKPKKESIYSQIIRYGAKTINDYWVVKDKNGTKRFYGQSDVSCVGSGTKKFTWNLTKIEDSRGNNVIFEYLKDNGYVYPSIISYTGFKESKGNYSVQFNYENDTNEKRKDIRIDARSTELVSCEKLLNSITTHYKSGEAIRTYKFTYQEGLAKEKMLSSIEVSNNANEKYEYSFKYTEPEKKSNGEIIYFASPIEWINGQPLQVGNSTSSGTSFNASAGVGYGTRIIDARVTGGGSGSLSSGESHTEDSLVDINGDGRIDSIKQEGQIIWVALNNGFGFDEYQQISIKNGRFNGELDSEVNSGSTVGWNIYGGAGAKFEGISVSLGAGYSEVNQKSSSSVLCSFMDMDRDGLVDIVESGKSTYLKNKGNLTFYEQSIHNSSGNVISDTIEKLSEEEIKEYENTYFVQTPFRMWKAPYEGLLSIKENANLYKTESNSNVEVQTFINDSNKHTNLSFNVPGQREEKNIETKKDDRIYFISNNGREPLNTDLEWNIDIEYSHIKALKQIDIIPYFILDEFTVYQIDEEIESSEDTAGKTEEEIKAILSNQIKEGFEKTEIYFDLYSLIYENNENEYSAKLIYNENWKDKLSEEVKEKIYSQLIEDNYFLPRIYTKEIFNQICEKLKSSDYDDNKIKNFAQSFEYDATTELYELIIGKDDLQEFYNNYNDIIADYKKECLSLYYLENTEINFSEDDFIYTKKTENIDQDDIRAKDIIGSIYSSDDFSSKKIFLGYITDLAGNDISIEYDFTNKKIFENQQVSNRFSVKTEDDGEEEIIFTKENEYDLIIKLSNKTDRAKNISKIEMDKIVKDYEVEKTNIYDECWNWKIDKEFVLTEGKLITDIFNDIELDEGEKENFISFMYEKKSKYKTEEEPVLDGNEITEEESVLDENGNETTIEKEILEYEYYAIKENPKYEAAQKILDDYKFRKVVEELFDFYSPSETSEEFILKEEWQQAKTEEELNQQYGGDQEKIEEYNTKNSLLIEKCNFYNLQKYKTVSYQIIYNKEFLYEINNDTYNFTFLSDDGILNETKLNIQSKWNSGKDFSVENKNKTDVIATLRSTEDIDKETIEIIEDIKVGNKEFLYGGNNSWYYGIWKGNLEDKPFSEKNLLKFKENSQDISEEDFEQLKQNSNINTENQPQKVEEKVFFYLPQIKNDSEIVKDVGNLKNSGLSYSVDLENALLGTVSVNTEIQKTSAGKIYVSQYYMPFIKGNIIHCDRVGGNSFYKIEGIKKVSVQNSTFLMPTIRKTYTTGVDKTPNISVGIGSVSNSSISSNLLEDVTKIAKEGFSGSGTKGTNTSTSSVNQALQDISGDGIPDIIQISDNKITVFYGEMNNDGDISYANSKVINDVSALSESNSTVDVYGGSVSAGGNIAVIPTGYKNLVPKTKTLSAPSPSGGITYSKGTYTQNKGFLDINGDGLVDYYNGQEYILNTGEVFKRKDNIFSSVQMLSNGENQSIGLNFSLGFGADLYKADSLSSGASVGIGGNYSFSSSNTTKMMMDINGDGLQDIIKMDVGESVLKVKYNTGNSFLVEKNVHIPDWGENILSSDALKSQADSSGYDIKILGNNPVFGGKIEKGLSNISINPYGANSEKYANSLDWSSTVTLGINGNLGANINIGIDLWVPVYIGTINVTASTGAGANASTSINGASVKMMDLDGDGLVDHVLRVPGVATYWKRNISGKYGQLNQINLPQGGNIQIEYEEKYGTVDNPNFKYVMSKVITNDGCNTTVPSINHGNHSLTIKYEYNDGYYDRYEKEFYGFETVKTINPDETYQIDTYYTKDGYYAKGVLKESVQYDKDKFVLSKSFTKLCESPRALPEKEENWIYEKTSGNEYIYTSTEYEYDEYGNCTQLTQVFANDEKLIGRISYDNNNTTDYIIGLPTEICVYDKNYNLLRKREGSYNEYGELTELRQFYTLYEYSVNTLTYDEYGNISSVKDSIGATLSYIYDEDENMFVKEISQSGNDTDTYKSFVNYNVTNQTKTKETDCNGNSISYEYDSWQRLVKIFTSYDSTIPAVSYEYVTPNKDSSGKHALWYAITNNKVLFDHDDTTIMQTVLQVDGLGRVCRTAKTGLVYRDGTKISGWNASGAVEYDKKGRTVKEGMTEFISGTLEDLLLTKPSMSTLFTQYEYDEKDRQIRTTLPDKSIQQAEFYLSNNKQVTKSIDPLGNVSIQKTDSRGNIVEISKENLQGKELTKVTYEYNAMGEMLFAFDAKGNPIKVEYDLLGRRTALESKDSGRQEFFYDANSNLVKENNSVLKEQGKEILYEYDGLNRLVKIDYPYTEDTIYTYGDANEPKGAAGKILNVTDASGTLEYEYGKLGEVTKETRTLKKYSQGNNEKVIAVMEYCSDYLGRMQYIVYPDGEKITYGYDEGGQVTKVTGVNYGKTFDYVIDIGYDEYGQRVYIEYGNGVKTNYTYDPTRRWLSNIKTHNAFNVQFQNIDYKFDLVGNVLSYTNNCLTGLNGNYSTTQSYSYDDLYQLIRVDGETIYNPYQSYEPEYISNYTQEFTFDTLGLGNMTTKTSTEKVSPHKTIGDDLNYNFVYNYDKNYAHRLVNVGNRYYKYDSNGNIILEQEGAFEENEEVVYRKVTEETEDVYSTDYGWGLFKGKESYSNGGTRYKRTYTWNEKNQLISSVDANYSTAYVYGQDGQRSNKYTANSETLYFNKMWTLHTDTGNAVKGGQYAKNIYLGETRIVTKLNSGIDPKYQEEYYKQYFYHSDHLGSASLISDYKGEEYQRIEYTPYGETWVEKTNNTNTEFLPYKFTGKEQDEETGLYYYGARYLDPKYSLWISTDPALGDYIPQAPVNDEAKKNNQNLPGMGGVFNHINSNLYHYAGNNPVKYTDPDGNDIEDVDSELVMSSANEHSKLGNEESNDYINKSGCVLTSYTRIANSLGGKKYTLEEANQIAIQKGLYTNGNELTSENGANLVNALLNGTGKSVTFAGSINPGNMTECGSFLNSLENSVSKLYVTARLETYDQTGTKRYQHTVNINSNAVIAGNIMDMANAFNIKVNDTSGVRNQVNNDVRQNKILRIDYFRVN